MIWNRLGQQRETSSPSRSKSQKLVVDRRDHLPGSSRRRGIQNEGSTVYLSNNTSICMYADVRAAESPLPPTGYPCHRTHAQWILFWSAVKKRHVDQNGL